VLASGEEDLLAHYLTRLGPDGQHDFAFPDDVDGIVVPEGAWEKFQANPQRAAQREADAVSYLWDRLIQQFGKHALQGTQYFVSARGIRSSDLAVRFMPREPRLRRRTLATALGGLVLQTPSHIRASRVVPPPRADDPLYVFLLLPPPSERSYEAYRTGRRNLLEC